MLLFILLYVSYAEIMHPRNGSSSTGRLVQLREIPDMCVCWEGNQSKLLLACPPLASAGARHYKYTLSSATIRFELQTSCSSSVYHLNLLCYVSLVSHLEYYKIRAAEAGSDDLPGFLSPHALSSSRHRIFPSE